MLTQVPTERCLVFKTYHTVTIRIHNHALRCENTTTKNEKSKQKTSAKNPTQRQQNINFSD